MEKAASSCTVRFCYKIYNKTPVCKYRKGQREKEKGGSRGRERPRVKTERGGQRESERETYPYPYARARLHGVAEVTAEITGLVLSLITAGQLGKALKHKQTNTHTRDYTHSR